MQDKYEVQKDEDGAFKTWHMSHLGMSVLCIVAQQVRGERWSEVIDFLLGSQVMRSLLACRLYQEWPRGSNLTTSMLFLGRKRKRAKCRKGKVVKFES